MKNTQRKTVKSYLTIKQRVTAAVTAVVMLAQICIPTVALAATAWGNNFESRLASELNSPMVELINDLTAPEAYKGAYFIHKSTLNQITLDSFYQNYPKAKPTQKPKFVGDSFVQSRIIRAQYRSLMGRYFFSGVLRSEETEAVETSRLYENAKTYAAANNLTLGNPLGNATPAQDMIWPELKQINGKSYLVPVVHLSQNTLNNKVAGHLVEFDSNAVFAGIQLDFATLVAGYNSTITGLGGIINNSGNIKSPGNLTLATNATFANMGGSVTATENLTIYANDFYNKTLVVPYKDKNGEGTRLGAVAGISAQDGSLFIKAANNITFAGATANAGGTLKLNAAGDINILPVQTGGSSQTQEGHWKVNKNTTDLLMSRLAADDTLSLIASGVINITASELISTKGGIELLAGQGIHIIDELEQTQIQKVDRKGKTTGTSSEFRTEAVRAILKAGKGVLLDSERGDVVLKATEITSAEGAQVQAKNGKVQLLMTKELEEFHLQTVKKGTWTIKTRTEDVIHENNIQNAIIGGLQVQAKYGIDIEYTGKEGATLKEQIEEYRKMPEMKWMADLYDRALAEAGPNLKWEELEEIHKELRKTKKNLSPAAMAIIAIAVAVVTAGAGAALVGAVQGSTYAAIANTALTTIATQAAQSLAVGDSPSETLKKRGSKDSIKNLAVSIATAGAMQNIPDIKIFEVANTSVVSAASIANQAVQAVVNSVVSVGISVAVTGGNSSDYLNAFKVSLATSAINAIGQKMSTKIGALAKDGRISDAVKYIAHAGLGCAIGVASAKASGGEADFGEQCSAGGGGAVVGEYVGNLYAESLAGDLQEWSDNFIAGRLSGADIELQKAKFIARGVDMSKLAAAFAAFFTGGDVNTAALTAENAAKYNSLNVKIYKWQDENGKWHFSDHEMHGVPVTPLGLSPEALAARQKALDEAWACFKQNNCPPDVLNTGNPEIDAQLREAFPSEYTPEGQQHLRNMLAELQTTGSQIKGVGAFVCDVTTCGTAVEVVEIVNGKPVTTLAVLMLVPGGKVVLQASKDALSWLKNAFKKSPSAAPKNMSQGEADDFYNRLDQAGHSQSADGIWSKINATQPLYPGSVIPKSFEMTLENGNKVWVHGNASEHLIELANVTALNYTPEKVRLASQIVLSDLQGAVSIATKNGIRYDEIIKVGRWDLKFSAPREAGQLPALIHAQPN